jgi:hypothetical protein
VGIPVAVPLEEFLEHLNLTGTNDESEVLRQLASATGVAEGIIGPIVHRQVISRLSVSGGSGILTDAPIVEVTQLLGLRGAPTYVTAQVDVDGPTGIVTGVNGRLTDGAYTATYTAGRAATEDEVDEDTRLAVCIIGKHLWETQRGRGQARGGALATTGPVQDERVPSGFLIPHRARTLLEPDQDLPIA